MNELNAKRKLEDQGIKIADVVRHFQTDFSTLSPNYAKKVIYGLISGKEWYPVYALWFQNNYNIEIQKPFWALPVRERMKLQAA